MESRKASDILLEMENKIDVLLNLVRTQDLNIKILSNKINDLNDKYKQMSPMASTPVKIEAANFVPVSSENILPQETSPKGFRRTSRPETYSGDDKYLPNGNESTIIPKFPIQIPKISHSEPEVVVPSKNISKPINEVLKSPKMENHSTIPISQRVVNKNGKSIYLADVEIIDLSTMTTLTKTRTNGSGRWMSSLPIGQYRIFIKKRESVNKDILETSQDIIVDGSQSPLELKIIIIT